MDLARTIWAFLVRDLRTARSYRLSWLLNMWGGLFQLVLYYYISRIVDTPALELAAGHTVSYFAFVVIGMALYRVMSAGLASFAGSITQEQSTGTLEVLFTLPVSPAVTVFGIVVYGFALALATSLMLIIVAVVFFGLRFTTEPMSLLAALIAFLASIVLFASLGIVIGAYTLVFKRASPVVGMVSQFLGLLSGVYFPISLLPRPVQLVSELIPLTWALDVLRRALLAGEVAPLRILSLVAACAVAAPAALWVFDQAVQHARRAGSLARY